MVRGRETRRGGRKDLIHHVRRIRRDAGDMRCPFRLAAQRGCAESCKSHAKDGEAELLEGSANQRLGEDVRGHLVRVDV